MRDLDAALTARFRRQAEPPVLAALADELAGVAPAQHRPLDDLTRAALLVLAQPEPSAPRLRVLPFVALAFAAGIAAIVAVSGPSAPEDDGALVPKGRADRLMVAVERDQHRFQLSSGAVVREGDKIAFFHSNARAGFLAVLHRTDDGQVTRLHPTHGEVSAAIEVGQEGALPDGAEVHAPGACEWIVAIFSDQPLALADLEQAVGSAPRDACSIDVRVAGARSVDVLSVTR